MGEIARALARQLDAACEAGTARGMSACPPLARRLGEMLDALTVREAEEAEEATREAERAERLERRVRRGDGFRSRTGAHELSAQVRFAACALPWLAREAGLGVPQLDRPDPG